MIDTFNESSSSSKKYIRRLVIFCILIFLGVFFRDVYDISINKYVFLFISILAYLFLNESLMVAFIVFMIPFLAGLPANYIIGVAIPIIIMKQKRISLNIFAIAAFAFLFLQLLHLFAPLSSIGEFFKFSVYIILITVILLRKGRKYDYKIILLSYGLGVIASFTSIFINSLKYVPLSLIFEEGVRIGNISWVDPGFDPNDITLTIDQNTLGYFCVIALAVFLILFYAKRLHPIFAIPLIIITFIYGSLTLSRTFILISIGVFLYYFIINLRINKASIRAIVSIIVVTIAILVTIQIYFPSTIEMLTKRFDESDITNGRTLIFEQYNQFMFSSVKNFLFGIGLQNLNIKANISHVTHNGIQQVFVSGGILSVGLIFTWIFGMYLNNRPKNNRNNLVNLLPFLTLLIYIQAIQFLSPYIIMLPLIVVFCALRLPEDLLKDG